MEEIDNKIASNYNYYPRTSILLSAIAYERAKDINKSVYNETNQELQVVWGPAELTNWDGITYSLMYVAWNSKTDEYFVVIRGTNFISLRSWLNQDFDVASTELFSKLPGNLSKVPNNVIISQGTFNGMSDLISLKDPDTNLSVVDFLKSKKPGSLYVTGHSLGGTLTPPMFVYLNTILYGGIKTPNMALWSFAGLTAGGTGFNKYLNDLVPFNNQQLPWRIHNSLDIAPLMWYSEDSIKKIYIEHKLEWSFLEKDPIEYLFKEANSTNIGYSQPSPGISIEGIFDSHFPEDDSWALQAFHQHHSATYKILVDKKYPE